MQTEYIDERGYDILSSDVAPRKPGTIHLEPNFPGATSLKDAKPLCIGGEQVTAELKLLTGRITIFVGTKIVYYGSLPKGIETEQANSWVTNYVLNPQEPREVVVTLAWLAQPIIDGIEDWTRHVSQPAIDVKIESSGDLYMIREPIGNAGIMVCDDADLVHVVATCIELNDLDVADLIGRGCVDDLEDELVKILVYAQSLMPQLKIMVQGDGLTLSPAECIRPGGIYGTD